MAGPKPSDATVSWSPALTRTVRGKFARAVPTACCRRRSRPEDARCAGCSRPWVRLRPVPAAVTCAATYAAEAISGQQAA